MPLLSDKDRELLEWINTRGAMALERAPTIDELGLGARINNPILALCAMRGVPPIISSLTSFTALELLGLHRLGTLAVLKVRRALFERGLRLRGDEQWDPAGPIDERGRYRKKGTTAVAEKPAVVKKPAFVPVPRVRGSAFNAGLICPGSVFLQQKADAMKVEQENQYTSVGKIGHKYLELRMTKSRAAAESHLDNEGASSDFRIELADFWDWLSEEGILPVTTKDEAADLGVELHAEKALKYKAGAVTITGTLDLVEVVHDAAVVVDWKFYNRPDALPPIHADIQMIAYAVGAWQIYNVRQVTVYRVLCYHHRADTLEMDTDMLKVALEAVTEEAEGIWQHRHDLRPGAQCRMCFQAFHCPAIAEKFKAVDTHELQAYDGGDLMTRDDVLNFLLAVPLVEARIKEGIAAAKRFVLALGEPIRDLTSNMEWGPGSRKQDTIVDAAGCLGELAERTNIDLALTAAKTTKGGMEKVMKTAKMKPKERNGFFDFLRERNLMVKATTDPRWEWRNPRE